MLITNINDVTNFMFLVETLITLFVETASSKVRQVFFEEIKQEPYQFIAIILYQYVAGSKMSVVANDLA